MSRQIGYGKCVLVGRGRYPPLGSGTDRIGIEKERPNVAYSGIWSYDRLPSSKPFEGGVGLSHLVGGLSDGNRLIATTTGDYRRDSP